MEVNGKFYSMWGGIIKNKEKWIGGKLSETCDDRMLNSFGETVIDEITDITLKPNGDDSAYFEVHVKHGRNCGFDVAYGRIDGRNSNDGWLGFRSVYGDPFKIKERIIK